MVVASYPGNHGTTKLDLPVPSPGAFTEPPPGNQPNMQIPTDNNPAPPLEEGGPPPPASRESFASDLASLTSSQMYMLQQNMLDEASEAEKRPLMAPITSLGLLREEYQGAPGFVSKIDWLQSEAGYHGVRRTKGDGDCLYRSLAYAYIERLMRSAEPDMAVAMSLTNLQDGLKMLEEAGFQALVYEDFYDAFRGLIERIPLHEPSSTGQLPLTGDLLLQAMQDPEISNSIVVYLRLLTSAQIRADPDRYSPFLLHPETMEPIPVREFCEGFVEATGKEADHVQIQSLSRALRLNLKVAYLTPGGPDTVDFVAFTNDEAPQDGGDDLVLLYRPGHYDILERKDHE